MKILLIEDDVMIGENVQIALNSEGIDVEWAKDGVTGEAALSTGTYDALLLDLGLPQKDGINILQSLRRKGSTLPVMLVTARDTVPERIIGLNSGADDYLVKPFDLDEMIARLRALVRRSRGQTDDLYKSGDVVVNTATRQVSNADGQVTLSAREWTVLDALVARPGAILSRSQLEERLYGWAGDVESNAVEVYIHGLRKKLGQHFIINVRGLGYMVEKN
jgi:DNA-binding response OmpR family regulator